ncbi:MAG: hypothetical protein QXT45_04105 [Candidatus Bilamarchaeaceae archaeon]
MLQDRKLLFSDKQSAAWNTGDNPSTDIIDLHGGLAKNAFGQALSRSSPSRSMRLLFGLIVNESLTSSGSATVNIRLQDSADGSSWSDLLTTGALAYSTLTAGYVLNWYVPDNARRYLRVLYTVGTAATTGGKITAGLFMQPVGADTNA